MKKENYLVKYGAMKKGYTLIELILAICIIVIITPILTNTLKLFTRLHYSGYQDTETLLAIEQLRLYLAQYTILDKSESTILYIETNNGEYLLQEVNNKLIIQKGSLTFLNNVDNVEFYIDGDYWMLNCLINGEDYENWIAFS